MSAPLESVKQHCVFFNNLKMSHGGHGNTFLALGGNYTSRNTVDIDLARKLSNDPTKIPLPLAAGYYGQTPVSKEINSFGVYFEQNPIQSYAKLFGEFPNNLTPLDEHFVNAQEPDKSNFDAVADLHIELATLALQRNKTNVVTLMLGDETCSFYKPGTNFDYHYSMSSGSFQQFVEYRAYLSQKVAYLIKLLEATPDSNNQSLLDSTLVVGITDMGTGVDHTLDNAPFMFAGGKKFTRNGYLVDARGYTHDDFLDTIVKLLGVTLPNIGKGPIPGVIA